jgi:hypothetical protein
VPTKAPGRLVCLVRAFFIFVFDRQKGGKAMKKMIILGWLALFLPAIIFAQEKVEAPFWNVGDKWVFTQGNIEVIGEDKKSYALKFSKDTCILENVGFDIIIFEKSTLNRIYVLKEDKREKYSMGLKNIFNFPFSPGKQWKHAYSAQPIIIKGYKTAQGIPTLDYYENIKITGWEDIGVKAGKFRALRIEFVGGHKEYQMGLFPRAGFEFKNYYWYSPNVKYFVKCQYDKDWMKENKEIFDWELASFKLGK